MSALIAAIICTFEWTADEIVLELECSGDLVGAQRTDGLAGAVDFAWTGTDWKYHSMEDMPGEFNLLMGDGTREPLKRHEVDYAEKTLGVFVSMDGNENAEKHYLREQSVTFDDQMKTSKANKNDCMYTYILPPS